MRWRSFLSAFTVTLTERSDRRVSVLTPQSLRDSSSLSKEERSIALIREGVVERGALKHIYLNYTWKSNVDN